MRTSANFPACFLPCGFGTGNGWAIVSFSQGWYLSGCLSASPLGRTGAALFLVGFGLFLLFQGCRKQTDSPSPLKFLRSPSQCDTDGSAVLEAGEALLLGLVLSADACGVGLSAAAAGFSVYWLPFFAALLQTFFLSVGVESGKRLTETMPMAENRYTLLSGGIFLAMGLLRLFW